MGRITLCKYISHKSTKHHMLIWPKLNKTKEDYVCLIWGLMCSDTLFQRPGKSQQRHTNSLILLAHSQQILFIHLHLMRNTLPKLIGAKLRHMATEIWVNIGSGNGLLPDFTKPLPETMLTDHQWNPVTFILGQFHKRCLNNQSLNFPLKITYLKFHSNFPRGQWVKDLPIVSIMETIDHIMTGKLHFIRHQNCLSWWKLLCWQVLNILMKTSGPRLNIKTVLSTYGDFHVKDKTAVRTSYL